MLLVLAGVMLVSLSSALWAADRAEELFHAASQQFWNGEYRRSLENYRTLTERYPDHELYLDARFGLAKSYYELGQLNEAEPVFRTVQNKHPEKSVRGDALFSLVEIAILQDEIIKARNLLRTFLEVYPEHPIRKTAKEQLILLESTPTPKPAPLEDRSSSEETEDRTRPPKLKRNSGDTGKPEGLPSESTSRSRPVSPPPMRDVVDTPPAASTDSVMDSDTPPDQNQADTPERQTTDTEARADSPSGMSSRITPEDLLESRGESTTDTPGKSESPGRTDTGVEKRADESETTAEDRDRRPSDEGGRLQGNLSGETPVEPPAATSGSGDQSTSRETMDSGVSSRTLRKQLQRQSDADRPADAFETAMRLLERGDATADDYFRAARLSDELANPVNRSLGYLNKAIALSSNPPGRYFLLKADLLLQDEQLERASKLLGSYESDTYEDASQSQKARYHYLRGELLRSRGSDDEAFFEYMSAIQAASDSRWGSRAQNTIQNEY